MRTPKFQVGQSVIVDKSYIYSVNGEHVERYDHATVVRVLDKVNRRTGGRFFEYVVKGNYGRYTEIARAITAA